MKLEAQRTTVVAGVRREGWRAVLRNGDKNAWRCGCYLPHSTADRAMLCGFATLSKRISGFRQGRDYMDEWLPAPKTPEQWQDFAASVFDAVRELVPASVAETVTALAKLRDDILNGEATYESINDARARADYYRTLHKGVRHVRELSELVVLTCDWRIGRELRKDKEEGREATGTRGVIAGRDELGHVLPGGSSVEPPGNGSATLREKGIGKTYSHRAQAIAPLPLESLESLIRGEFHARGKEAHLDGIVQHLRMEERVERTRWNRMNSLTAPRIESGIDLRIGDCRVVLSDIEDNSVAMILTDPPYGHDAEPLYEWLAKFAARVLIPGGSLICYTGQGLLPRDIGIFGRHLRYWWQAVMMHDSSQKMIGARVFAKFKPILWYVKDTRRGRTIIPDVLYAKRNKTEHSWSQGDGGVGQWIHELTDPEETIVDPFAGTAEWGHIACEAGRRWIGSDIVLGGTTEVQNGDLAEGEEETS